MRSRIPINEDDEGQDGRLSRRGALTRLARIAKAVGIIAASGLTAERAFASGLGTYHNSPDGPIVNFDGQ